MFQVMQFIAVLLDQFTKGSYRFIRRCQAHFSSENTISLSSDTSATFSWFVSLLECSTCGNGGTVD